MTTFDLRDVPLPGPLRLPVAARRQLPNGLRLIAARRGSAPLAEACLSMPYAHADPAVAVILAGAITADPEVQDRLRSLGAGLSAAVDADMLRIAGSVPADRLREFLVVLAETVRAPAYPADELAATVDSAVQATIAMLSDPAQRAVEALNGHVFGDHPYGRPSPRVADLGEVGREAVLAQHHDRVRPGGATLVLTGDIDPDQALDVLAQVFDDWEPGAPSLAMPPVPPFVPGKHILDEPGVTQSILRMTLPVPRHYTPGYPALAMAAAVFGGYFSSRLVQNIREDKGFSYSPRCSLMHVAKADLATITVDVVTANTAAAVEEVTKELDALVTRPVTFEELDRARRYTLGTLRLRLATLTGLTGMLCELDLHGLPIEWLRGHDALLATVTPEQVTEAAAKHLRPEQALTVLLCDEAAVFGSAFRG